MPALSPRYRGRQSQTSPAGSGQPLESSCSSWPVPGGTADAGLTPRSSEPPWPASPWPWPGWRGRAPFPGARRSRGSSCGRARGTYGRGAGRARLRRGPGGGAERGGCCLGDAAEAADGPRRLAAMIDFKLSPEQEQIRQLAHKFAEREIRPAAPGYDEREETPWPILEKAAEIGLTSYPYPQEFGGGGRGG